MEPVSQPPPSADVIEAVVPREGVDSLEARWRWYFAAVLVATAVLDCARLGARALWGSEGRWAEIAREMLVTHNYFWPTINGRSYFDKPLGSYWLVIASTWVTGAMNEAAARLPCAVAGILAVAFLMMLARRLYDSRTALASGIILATSFSFVFFSRTASADVATITGELAASLLFVRNQHRPAGWWVIGLWTIMAVTSQMKGLLGFVLPILIIGTYCCVADGWIELGTRLIDGPARFEWLVERNRWLFNPRSLVAIPIGVAIYYAPFAISSHLQGSHRGIQLVLQENVVRYFRPFDHREPIYLYVYIIFELMAPWAILLPAALADAHRRRSADDVDCKRSDRFTLTFFWATFVFFTLSGSRRSYYILPILPAAAILIARTLTRDGPLPKLSRSLLSLGFGIIALAIAVSIVAIVPPHLILRGPLATLPNAPDQMLYAILWLVSVAGVFYALRRYSPRRVAISTGIAAYLAMIYLYVFAMPAVDAFRGEKSFALETVALLHDGTSRLAFYKTLGPVFYLNSPSEIPRFDNPAELSAAIKKQKLHWIITRRRDLAQIRLPAAIKLEEASFPWEGASQRRDKQVLIELSPPPQN